MNAKLTAVKEEISKVLRGKDDEIDMILCAMLAGGHILLEDIPGVGKTTLAVALSRSMSLSYRRMQFTPDVLPSDILGFSLLDQKTGDFTYHPGAIFTNLFLADEINRTSPKTQSALLEVMEEGSVSVDGVTRALDKPFFVIATQNPIGASGTQKLPDSQLDRFFIRLSLGYPDHKAATEILMGKSSQSMDDVQVVMSGEEILQMQKDADAIFVKGELLEYIVSLTEKTRGYEYLAQGISPRGSIAILKLAKAYAYYMDRRFLAPDDIHAVFYAVCNHRLILNTKAKAAGLGPREILNQILSQVPIPRISLQP
ncbi:MAG: MoxR family ATPase [Lachnospiraceae bacterium]|nr:MoxR family ATPase [Lachnospiraceae bacterium]